LSATTFNPSGELRRRVAATEESCKYERRLAGAEADRYTGWRAGVIRGEVHDQNAWVLGGVAGNAGLFSTARETAMIAMEYLGERAAAKGLLGDEAIRLAQQDQTPGLNEARTFAFRIALPGETAAGPALPPAAFGHNGFTGTSVWIDPERLRVYVLLTNRVHPVASDSVDMLALRRRFHSLASRV
jgi:CubicO group peptidase (beta-lactamase class C family)